MDDLPGWRQVVAEDFDAEVPLGGFSSSPYSPGFSAYDGFADTFGHGRYDPAEVLSVQDGSLDWDLHTSEGVHHVAAVVVTVPGSGWGQTYGRYSVRFRSDAVPGYKLAFLLWPDTDRWGEGEIDFPEAHSLDSDAEIVANLYRTGDGADTPGTSAGFDSGVAVADSGWHVATVEWLPSSLTFELDGVVLGTKTAGVPSTSMHWVLQVETAESGPDDSARGHVQVDWVAAWSPE
ncbi:glycoside hydrolase family 16 protein [Friedmanniella luteola]|uniref:glycoside hydrolase family 16 protein n=1 Tax=Friedmanniella luteola TaxID=546871 RepID=UPI0012FE0B78|nr:glycoside hydrolase family 16 protein [Friedmanniella luteola]